MNKRIKIIVTGTRGIPDIQGGVETHCEKLYPRLAQMGCDITLVRRSCYIRKDNIRNEYLGVKLKDIYAPRNKSFEAIIHTFLAVLYAKKQKAHIVHIHAIGPGLLTPVARLLGLKVVFTHHGTDYARQKWGWIAKWILKTGEILAVKYANEVIVISEIIKEHLIKKYSIQDKIHLIYNGVDIPVLHIKDTYLRSLRIEKNKYIFTLGRFVEEKGFHDLILAYLKSSHRDQFKLVIAGDADHKTAYSENLKKLAIDNGVILTGFVNGDNLSELFSHAALFVLPSFHEGLPISLLEAMSYRLPVLASNIPANKVLIKDEKQLFTAGNIEQLTSKLNSILNIPKQEIQYDLQSYDWDNIAKQTLNVYNTLVSNNR